MTLMESRLAVRPARWKQSARVLRPVPIAAERRTDRRDESLRLWTS